MNFTYLYFRTWEACEKYYFTLNDIICINHASTNRLKESAYCKWYFNCQLLHFDSFVNIANVIGLWNKMEVFRTDDYFIFVKERFSLWWDRHTGSFIPKSGIWMYFNRNCILAKGIVSIFSWKLDSGWK